MACPSQGAWYVAFIFGAMSGPKGRNGRMGRLMIGMKLMIEAIIYPQIKFFLKYGIVKGYDEM